MTRKALRDKNESRLSFTATFSRFGTKTGWRRPEKTLLLQNVRFADGGGLACDHIWFTCGKTWEMLNLEEGDHVRFDARVKRYEKGYFGSRTDVYKPATTDYKLSHPTRISKGEDSP
mgnify:CR=1 FL=1